MTDPRDLLLTLNSARGIARAAACRLAQELESWWPPNGPDDEAAARIGVPQPALRQARALACKARAFARAELERATALGARVVTRLDPGYPEALQPLDLPPPVLFVQGLPLAPEQPAAALVGSRQADVYGREVAGLLGRELAVAGVAVVSGFAVGIDAAAHRGALAAPPAERPVTVAVLGSGLGTDYPRGHRELGMAIARHGALVSEFPCGSQPRPWRFPVRNRLIAALSGATVVIRATPRSGSLVTARLALELGREVLAVPGRIFDDISRGPNELLADGARPALSSRDVLDALGVPAPRLAPKVEPVLAGILGRLLARIPIADPVPPEDLAADLGEPVEVVLGALLELELLGRVHRYPGPGYARGAV
jgi:DNA processing protein